MATRWGIVGAGKISHDFVSCLRTLPQDEHQVAAVAARSVSSAEKFAQLHQIPKAYGSYLEIAKDPNIDVTYIGVVHPLHYETAKLMLENGKNVLCEKPCTLTLKHTRELTELARSKNLFFMEAIWSRFFPIFQDLAQLLKSGAIGEPQYVHASFGKVYESDSEGSSIMGIGIYCLNLIQFVFGNEMPTQIAAVGHLTPQGDDRSIAVSLKYSNNRLANIATSGNMDFPNEGLIVGDKGTLKILSPFWCPTKLQTPEKLIEHSLPETALPCNYPNSSGLRYEAMEVRRCLKEGLIESPTMAHKHSELLASIMDEVRKQLGVKFDVDDW